MTKSKIAELCLKQLDAKVNLLMTELTVSKQSVILQGDVDNGSLVFSIVDWLNTNNKQISAFTSTDQTIKPYSEFVLVAGIENMLSDKQQFIMNMVKAKVASVILLTENYTKLPKQFTDEVERIEIINAVPKQVISEN